MHLFNLYYDQQMHN